MLISYCLKNAILVGGSNFPITYSNDVVDIVFSSVLHVILEHLNNLIDVELPCSAELEQEFINVPRILGRIVLLYPFLELAEAHFLFF